MLNNTFVDERLSSVSFSFRIRLNSAMVSSL